MKQAAPKKLRFSIGIMLATLIAAIDSTMMGVIGPKIATNLNGMDYYPWLLTAFMATTTIATMIFGKLADRYSSIFLYYASIVLFCLGSLICAISFDMFFMILGRFVQGIGAGGMFTLGLILLGKFFDGDERAKMQARQSAMWGLAAIIGPSLGAVIGEWSSWRFLFLINLPAALLIIWLLYSASMKENNLKNKGKLDIPGTVWLSVSLLLILTVPTLLQNQTMYGFGVLVLLLGIGCFFIFLRVERRAQDPALPLRLLRNSNTLRAVWIGFLGSTVLFSTVMLIPLLIQNIYGSSLLQSGIVILLVSLGYSVGGLLTGKLQKRVGDRILSLLGVCLIIVGLLGLQFNYPPSSLIYLLSICGLLIGVGMGFITLGALLMIQSDSDPDKIGTTTGLYNFSRNLGNALGPAFIGGYVFIRLSLKELQGSFDLESVPSTLLVNVIHEALWFPFLLASLLILVTISLPRLQQKKTLVLAAKKTVSK